MRCVAVCQTTQVARNLWQALVPDLDVEVIVKNKTLYPSSLLNLAKTSAIMLE